MTKAIIFDLDGLLIDSVIISYKIYKEILLEYGHDFKKEDYARKFSGKTEIKNVNYLIEKYQLPWTLEEGLEKVDVIERKFIAEGVDLKPGAKFLLDYLKENNYKIAIASSSTKDRAMNILSKHRLIKYFDAFVFGHEVEKGKPNPDIFIKAAEKITTIPAECLVLEDSEAGIQAAYSANIPVICIPDMKTPSEDKLNKTVCVLKSLNDVISWLENN